jgi:hypothetical protein
MKSLRRSVIFTVITLFAAVLALSSATFAWFTSNGEVFTTRVDATTADPDARLLISTQGGSAFKGRVSCEINQINKADPDRLLPVSTSDLEDFAYPVNMSETDAAGNHKLTLDVDEKRYYHGCVYLEASVTGLDDVYSSMDLYLDEVGKMVDPESGSLFANAGRIGLIIEGRDPIIIYMSDEDNPAGSRGGRIQVGGNATMDGKVVSHSQSRGFFLVDDPAVSLESVSASNSRAKPLANLRLNRIYRVDVFFYLEGCDEDCVEQIALDAAEVYLSFYGVPR